MKITITDFIDGNHRSHYWYGGECARIEYKGYTAIIEAIGDVYVEYYKGEDCLVCFKDKANSGRFYDELNYYIKNDKELYEAINMVSSRNDSLIIDNNNWWECFIIDKDGNFHDLMWALDDDYLDEAVGTVIASLDEMIKYVEEAIK